MPTSLPDALPILLISLPHSTARRESAVAALGQAGYRAEVLCADDGSSAEARRRYSRLAARLRFGRALSPAEVGCFISHRHAAARIIASGRPFGLVLEDDAAPAIASDALEGLLGDLPAQGWLLANLGRAPEFLFRPLAATPAGGLLRAHYFPLTSHALLWSRAGAEAFLAATETVFMPVDHFLRRWLCRSGLGLALAPPAFVASGVPSEIDRDRSRAELVRGRVYRGRRSLRRWRNKGWAAFRAGKSRPG